MIASSRWFPSWRRALQAAVALLFLAPVGGALADEPVVLVFGDSLSAAYGFDRDQAWPVLVEQRMEEAGLPHRVVNTSRSGETTSGGLRRLPETLERHEPELLVLQLGGNDGLRGQPPERVQENLAHMLEKAQERGAQVLLLGIRIPPNYGRTYTERFEAIYPDLAERYGVALIPFMLEGIWNQDGMMQDDGIHPTAEAQPKIADKVWETLQEMLDAPS